MQTQTQTDERNEWIAAYGSEYLRTAVAQGYAAQRAYVVERAAKEHPGYTVDLTRSLEYDEIDSPSPAALSEAIADGARVVLLAFPPNTQPEDWDGNYEPREALILEDYLGEYTLVREPHATEATS